MKTGIFNSHRLLAKILAIPVLLWALSGLMHPFIANWFKPTIAHKTLPTSTLPAQPGWREPADIARAAGIDELAQIHMAEVSGRWLYQFITPDQQRLYFDATSGIRDINADVQLAKERAAAYAGLSVGQITSVKRIDAFNETYRFINRYLPVYQVQFDTEDDLQVYIDPLTQKLAAFSNRNTRAYRWFFAYAHNWSFLGDASSPWRVTLVLVAIVLITWIAISGLINYLQARRRSRSRKYPLPLRKRLHRWAGLSTSVLYLMLAVSGVTHVYSKYRFDWGFLENHARAVAVADLQTALLPLLAGQPVQGLALAQIDGAPAYRLALADKPGATAYHNTRNGGLIDNGDQRYARELAAHFGGTDTSGVGDGRLLTKFGKTYPVILKRLPVQQFRMTEGPYMSVTVDTAHAHLAGRMDSSGLIERIIFLNLHKFHFMDVLSKEGRDWLSVIAALLIIITTSFGVSMLGRRPARRQEAKP